MRNLRLDLCYDGTRYHGWQRLGGNADTIQGKLEQTLSRILGESVEVHGSGRTDAGVHARAQVASFHCMNPMPARELLLQLRQYLPEDIGAISCTEVQPDFHARLHALRKIYVYRIWNSNVPCVFERRYTACFPETLDMDIMNQAAGKLVGKHDFAAFCTRRPGKKSTVRTLYRLEASRCGNEIQIIAEADGFLYNMVRILVGTLIEVGRGERRPEDISALFDGVRADTGFLAPAKGLCLTEVIY